MKINTNEYEKIIELSKTLKQKDIAALYNVKQATISLILIKNGIKNDRYRLNESKLYFDINYFDIIDNEKKAYWLGFIAADGCLKNNKVKITSKDIEIIIKFKNDLKSEHKISTSIIFDKRTKKQYIGHNISITNNLFTKKVEKYINTDKSDCFVLPKINDIYYPYFIAGMFDGDGTISSCGKHKNLIRIGLISTYECLLQIQDILLNIGIKKTILHQKTGNNTWVMDLYKDSILFLNFIYQENISDMYLSRKYEKYIKYKNVK